MDDTTAPSPRLLFVGPGERHNPQGSEVDHEGPETAQMTNTKPFEGPGGSQDERNDQEVARTQNSSHSEKRHHQDNYF